MRFALLFLQWYYLDAPRKIVRGYGAYAAALMEIIPLGFLLRTLLSPWKHIVDKTPMKGFDLKHLTESLALNLLARGVGCTVRILTMLLGIGFHLLLLCGSIIFLVVWIFFPILLIIGTASIIR